MNTPGHADDRGAVRARGARVKHHFERVQEERP